jgi:broad specificity phosphatase PhoE
MRKLAVGHIYTSPAHRAVTTAKIAGAIAAVPVSAHPELRSLDTGKLALGDEKAAAQTLKPYFDAPDKKIPGGESVNQWRGRHTQFMKRVAQEHKRKGLGAPVFVTHSNVVGSVVSGTDGARKAMANPPKAATAIKVSL